MNGEGLSLVCYHRSKQSGKFITEESLSLWRSGCRQLSLKGPSDPNFIHPLLCSPYPRKTSPSLLLNRPPSSALSLALFSPSLFHCQSRLLLPLQKCYPSSQVPWWKLWLILWLSVTLIMATFPPVFLCNTLAPSSLSRTLLPNSFTFHIAQTI